MTFFYILAALKAVFLGAIYGRLDGGGIAKVSEWVERSLIMFFFVLACAPFAGLWALFAYAGVVGVATGHGQYFLNRAVKAVEPERTDFITRLLFGQDPRTKKEYEAYRDDAWSTAPQEIKDKIHLEMQDYGLERLYWRNTFGMFVTGTLVGLPALVIATVFGAFLPALLFSLTGVAKAAAYVAGYKFFKNTESAEYLNGAFRTALCVVVILLVI